MLITFTLVFFLAGPVLILIASGYSFGEVVSLTKINFLRTGGVYISDIGSDSKVYIDGKDVGGTSFFDRSILVQSLLPKGHNLKVEREGYRSWEKRVVVFPKKVTEIHPVLISEKITYEKIKDVSIIASVKKELQKKQELLNASTTAPFILRSGSMRIMPEGTFINVIWLDVSDTPQYMCEGASCGDKLEINLEEKVFDLEGFPGTNYGLVAITNYGIYVVELDERGGRKITRGFKPEDFGLDIFIKPKLSTLDSELYLSTNSILYKLYFSKQNPI